MNAAAHANQIAFFALMAERCGGAVDRHDGTVSVALAHPFPFFNALLVEGDVGDPGAALEHAREFFTAHDRPEWSVFARPTGEDEGIEAAMKAAGLPVVNPNYREMARAEPIEPPPLAPEIALREVESDEERAAFWRLCGEAYASLNFPAEAFDGCEPLLHPPVTACLAWLDGRPVGGALVCLLEGVGFVGWVAASPEARGKGVGAAVTAWVTNRTLADGAEFASLQASPMGLPVYERLGYETLFDYRVWRYSARGQT